MGGPTDHEETCGRRQRSRPTRSCFGLIAGCSGCPNRFGVAETNDTRLSRIKETDCDQENPITSRFTWEKREGLSGRHRALPWWLHPCGGSCTGKYLFKQSGNVAHGYHDAPISVETVVINCRLIIVGRRSEAR